MISFEHVTKAFWYRGQPKYVARDIHAVIPTGAKIGILGRNGAGKSTLMGMIAGNINPDFGMVKVSGEISWPIGLTGCIQGDMTGAQNVRFIARVYGVDTDELVEFVDDFAELGANYYEPVKTYSTGMRGRLNFGMSMGIRFNTYLLDEVHSTGDLSFKQKAEDLFNDRMHSAGVVLISHSERNLRSLCTTGAVLEHGRLTFYDTIDEAIEAHNRNMRFGSPNAASVA
ncbi:ABC transporter ATP-binding protein [Rhodobacter sp. KR11]|jgi:capsular polysaccharide transport system ATP-binding protein|uniref:ABC transporter ATP-binding protein n=1 Tax=Rhodobacter sp. KR11 TaxID=2974588 RepID=UPI002221A9D5|nr:ABC transporter ATP-binding protein [Rhodobacter sp. KR11]MCW1917277.1 ABC transporter ATP-binding protein [Rhodobacter sp. KR11]